MASPYIATYVFRTGNIDKDLGMRRDVDGTFRIGNADVEIDRDSNVFVQGKSYKWTRGLFEILTRKKVDQSFITDRDLKAYIEVLEATHGHLENHDPSGVIKTTRGVKFKDGISKLFPVGGVTRVHCGKSGPHLNKLGIKKCQMWDSNPRLRCKDLALKVSELTTRLILRFCI